MSKKRIVILSIIVILIGVASILTTYALDITMTKGDSSNYDMSLTFDISGNVNKELSVESGKSKSFDIIVNNPYTDAITYGIAYKMLNPSVKPDELIIAVTNVSSNPYQGLINASSRKIVSLIIVNESSSNIQVGLTVVNGFKNGGDLILPDGYSFITDTYQVFLTEPNSPDLIQGLIPVVYNESSSKWVKADSSNSGDSWYNYNERKWANAVLVTSTNRSTYTSASVGTVIDDSDILGFYVWIPRYKYKVWNINKIVGVSVADEYDPQTQGVNIMFESETETTGTITCEYSYTAPSSEAGSPNETCTGANGDYYTHPAFTFGNTELRGLWVGKFELSSSSPNTGSSYGGGNVTNLTARILPNVTSWRNNTLSNFNTVIQNMQTSNNIYGLSTSRSNTDSHMIKNMEWGAVTYFTNSKYGRCSDGICTAVSINSYYDYSTYATKTGCGPQSSSSTSYGTTCNSYNTTLGVLASTTGNVYGIYDMSGGASEYVMGNTSSSSGSFTFYPSSSEFTSAWYNTESNRKYINTYAFGSVYNDQAAYNRGRLGDSTSEVVLDTNGADGWYSGFSCFPYSDFSWFLRGGSYQDGGYAGIFVFDYGMGYNDGNYSSRAILVSL